MCACVHVCVCVCVWGGGGGGLYTRGGGDYTRGGIHGGNISAANQNDMFLFYEDKYFLQLQN